MNSKMYPTPESIIDAIKESAGKKNNEEKTKAFNHFVATGEVLPETKDDNEHIIDVIRDLTSVFRPGPLSSLFTTIPTNKKNDG